MSDTVVCITTLNEARTISPLVRQLCRQGHAVIVSDGGSDDDTDRAALLAGAHVLPSYRRLPIGPALVLALDRALLQGYKRIVVMDAGGSHDPIDVARLLSYDADVVIGSRFVKGASYRGRPWRAVLSRLASVACNVAQPGAHYNDWTSGFRVYSRRAAQVVVRNHYRARMHAWQIETLARLGEAGMSVVEAPIRYTAGRSSFNLSVAREAFMVWLHMMNHIGYAGAKETA